MTISMRFYPLVALCLAVLGCGGGGGGGGGNANTGGNTNTPCPAPVQIQPDSVTMASLAAGDCTVVRLFPTETGDNSYLDQYAVTLPARGEFTVLMESGTLDSLLGLFDSDPPTLPELISDDDGGGNLDAFINIELPAGSYVIVANSNDTTGVAGNYTLTTTFTPVVWTPTSDINAPDPRTEHSAVWSGSEMIVWGGNNGNAITKNDGGRYDLQNDSWTATGTAGAPSPRTGHTAIWADSEMIVWGGGSGAPNFVALDDGASYDPQTDSWLDLSMVDVPAARTGHTAIWTGTEMIIWGGFSCTGCANGELGSGARYDPATDVWTPMNVNGAPEARGNHTAVWTGTRMIVWGGETDGGNATLTLLDSGGSYDPATDSWESLSLVSAPLPTRCHSAEWANSQMIVFGGQTDANLGCGLSTNGKTASYDPATDTWTALADAPVSSTISGARAIWTGMQLVAWFENTGARYDVGNDAWQGIDPNRAPDARRKHTLIWTGGQMIVWGGEFAGVVNSGAVYAPDLDLTP